MSPTPTRDLERTSIEVSLPLAVSRMTTSSLNRNQDVVSVASIRPRDGSLATISQPISPAMRSAAANTSSAGLSTVNVSRSGYAARCWSAVSLPGYSGGFESSPRSGSTASKNGGLPRSVLMSCIGGAPEEAGLSMRLAVMTTSASTRALQLRAADTAPPEPLLSSRPTTSTTIQRRNSNAPIP